MSDQVVLRTCTEHHGFADVHAHVVSAPPIARFSTLLTESMEKIEHGNRTFLLLPDGVIYELEATAESGMITKGTRV